MWLLLFELIYHKLPYFELGWLVDFNTKLITWNFLVDLEIEWHLFNFEVGSNSWIFRCSATTDGDTSIKMAPRLAEPRLNQYFANILHRIFQHSNIGRASGSIISCKNIPQESMRFWGFCH